MKRQKNNRREFGVLAGKYQYIDDVFDQMASRWAIKAERLASRKSMQREARLEV